MLQTERMTFSILTFDQKTGSYAGAAATGSLCVGGWVLRGDIEAGLVASQGTAPSTFWRDDCLRRFYAGQSAESALKEVVYGDEGRAHRQLIGLDKNGRTAGFTGAHSVPFAAHHTEPGLAVAGNMLAGAEVLDALRAGFRDATGPAADRLLAALRAAAEVGGDSRGLVSAALLVLAPDTPPLDLRIDRSSAPVGDLRALLSETRAEPYAGWLQEVPVLADRHRSEPALP